MALIIVGDGGSTDGSVAMLRQLAARGWLHGDDFCAAILDGKRKRDDVSGQAAA